LVKVNSALAAKGNKGIQQVKIVNNKDRPMNKIIKEQMVELQQVEDNSSREFEDWNLRSQWGLSES
jgi:hypothetical protein